MAQMHEMNKKLIKDYDIDDLKKGMSVHYTTRITQADVDGYANICGDISPLHVDPSFGSTSRFGGNIVHGMLVSSHFSTLAGVFLPGRNALLSGMQLDFVHPVPVGAEITVSASVIHVQRMQRMIVLRLLAFVESVTCVKGEAKVKILPPEKNATALTSERTARGADTDREGR